MCVLYMVHVGLCVDLCYAWHMWYVVLCVCMYVHICIIGYIIHVLVCVCNCTYVSLLHQIQASDIVEKIHFLSFPE